MQMSNLMHFFKEAISEKKNLFKSIFKQSSKPEETSFLYFAHFTFLTIPFFQF